MTNQPDPKDALAQIQAARSSVVRNADYPVGYDIAYGGVCALLVAGQGMPSPWSFIVLPIALGGLALMVAWWRKRVGWWVNGYSPKRARWVAFGLLVLFFALMGLSLYGKYVGPWWLFLVSGAIGWIGAALAGRLWMRVWRKEMSEDIR